MGQELDIELLNEILKRFHPVRESLIPVLQGVQDEFGYIHPDAVTPVAKYLKIFPSEVSGVITFYTQFTTTPRGKNVIRVCRGTACHVRGGRTVFQSVRKFTGLEDGETSEDMRFTFETVACLGACALSPVMVINKAYYGKLNAGRIEAVLKNLP
ncbi:MAG TPA: NAD(P)H-dependent oxidoreductase subunit E [Desulfomonilaceae bacterium]|nr:NAD(P)H-dependent oxidoreductase subunit E [Desulfomonilaceae bacterium]